MLEQETHTRMLDRTQEPTNADIIEFISNEEARTAWKLIQEFLETDYDFLKETVFYGERYGWVVRYRKSGRTIVSLFPEENSFSFLIVFGKKEIDKFSVQKSEFLPVIVDVFRNTKKLHDGKWLWIRVTNLEYFDDLKRLIVIKRKPKRQT